MAELPAVNASPLIFLTRVDLVDLLLLAAPEIAVPAPVADEIGRRGTWDPAASALARTNWRRVVA